MNKNDDIFKYIKNIEERLRILERQSKSFNRLERLSAPPEWVEGKIYFDTTLKKARVYDGTAWQNLH